MQTQSIPGTAPHASAAHASATHASAAGRGALLPAAAAAGLGLLLLWGVGFSHIDAVHNAAHDTRHANAFPCH
ncbi:CbtB domain-containing protein [Azospirillum sp. ST 5-10]|uniref:CbtB domain-containing protein n=1 Tax=unclassified Azospirillum TaxID=2630922 RepID=UPI003F4A8226